MNIETLPQKMKKEFCPCGSNRSFSQCCGPYLSGDFFPSSPESLMRSRYTAYFQANIIYIEKTMKGDALRGFNRDEAESWTKKVEWKSLTIVDAPSVPDLLKEGDKGYVEFIACYAEDNRNHRINERSTFQYFDGKWYYISGNLGTLKVERNVPCPCGSGKKYKKCCLKNA